MRTMIAQLHYQHEFAGETATMYLIGTLCRGDEVTLRTIVDALPPHIRMLRLDLHALDHADQDTVRLIHPLLRGWSERRGGTFSLAITSPDILLARHDGSPAHDWVLAHAGNA
jgi:hypothetical protein